MHSPEKLLEKISPLYATWSKQQGGYSKVIREVRKFVYDFRGVE